MPTKENKAGEQQPYIPAGNGDKSGEYTYKDSSDYSINENCTREDLKKLLSKEEYLNVYLYTNSTFGVELNRCIQINNLSNHGEKVKNLIISAIHKHKLKHDIVVYRGIKINNEIYLNEFYTKYIRGETIVGSPICSTTRDIKTAIKYSKSMLDNQVSLVFEINLPKGYQALPLEDIAINPNEQEILISKPYYRITKISDWLLKKHKFKKIVVELIEER